jgi:hypothetical protein
MFFSRRGLVMPQVEKAGGISFFAIQPPFAYSIEVVTRLAGRGTHVRGIEAARRSLREGHKRKRGRGDQRN